MSGEVTGAIHAMAFNPGPPASKLVVAYYDKLAVFEDPFSGRWNTAQMFKYDILPLLLDGITLGKPNLVQTPTNLDRVLSENDLLTAWLPTAIYFLPSATFLVVYFGHTGAMSVYYLY